MPQGKFQRNLYVFYNKNRFESKGFSVQSQRYITLSALMKLCTFITLIGKCKSEFSIRKLNVKHIFFASFPRDTTMQTALSLWWRGLKDRWTTHNGRINIRPPCLVQIKSTGWMQLWCCQWLVIGCGLLSKIRWWCMCKVTRFKNIFHTVNVVIKTLDPFIQNKVWHCKKHTAVSFVCKIVYIHCDMSVFACYPCAMFFTRM